jgi:hypothetical protein
MPAPQILPAVSATPVLPLAHRLSGPAQIFEGLPSA